MEETRGQTVGRRLKTIPVVLLAGLLVTALLPLLIVGALVVDIARWLRRRTPFVAVRLTAMAWCYLLGEIAGLLVLTGSWIVHGFGRRTEQMAEATWAIQRAWAGWTFGCVRVLFGMTLDIEGDDVVEPGPVILLIRHASIVDNLLPANLVVAPHDLRLRYVLKRELLMEPCLDVAGRRLPNWFVRRDSGDPSEIEQVVALARDMSEGEGVLIYPEGTRFTPERRDRGVARIAETDPERAARLSALQFLLAPRAGGVTGILEAAPGVDVLVCSHHGFDGLRLISDIWAGGLVGRNISVRFTRIPREDVPDERDEQVHWLDDVWLEMDRWVAARAGADVERLRARGRSGAAA